jgi:hypothetical protein
MLLQGMRALLFTNIYSYNQSIEKSKKIQIKIERKIKVIITKYTIYRNITIIQLTIHGY